MSSPEQQQHNSPTAEHAAGLDNPTVRVYRPKPVAQFLRRLPVDSRHEAVNYLTMLGLDAFASSGLFNHDAWQSLQVHSERALTNLRLLSKDVEPHLSAHFRSITDDRHHDPLDDEETLNVDPLVSPHRSRGRSSVGTHHHHHHQLGTSGGEGSRSAVSPSSAAAAAARNESALKTESRMISPSRRSSTSHIPTPVNGSVAEAIINSSKLQHHHQTFSAASGSNNSRVAPNQKSVSPSRKRYISPPIYNQDPKPEGKRHSPSPPRSQSVEFTRIISPDRNKTSKRIIKNHHTHYNSNNSSMIVVAPSSSRNTAIVSTSRNNNNNTSRRSNSARLNTSSDPRLIIIQNDGRNVRQRPASASESNRVAMTEQRRKSIDNWKRQQAKRNLNESEDVILRPAAKKSDNEKDTQEKQQQNENGNNNNNENDDEAICDNKGSLSTFVSMGYKDKKNYQTAEETATNVKKTGNGKKAAKQQHLNKKNDSTVYQSQYNTTNLPGHHHHAPSAASFDIHHSYNNRNSSNNTSPSRPFLRRGFDEDEHSPHGLRSATIRGMAAKLRSEAEVLIKTASKMDQKNLIQQQQQRKGRTTTHSSSANSNNNNRRPIKGRQEDDDDRYVVKSPSRRNNDVELKSFIDTQRQRLQSQRELGSDVDATIIRAPAKKKNTQQEVATEEDQHRNDDNNNNSNNNNTQQNSTQQQTEAEAEEMGVQTSAAALITQRKGTSDFFTSQSSDVMYAPPNREHTSVVTHQQENGSTITVVPSKTNNNNNSADGTSDVLVNGYPIDLKRQSPSRRTSGNSQNNNNTTNGNSNTYHDNNNYTSNTGASDPLNRSATSTSGHMEGAPKLLRAKKVALQLDADGEPIALDTIPISEDPLNDDSVDFQNAVPIRTSPTPTKNNNNNNNGIKNTSFVSDATSGGLTSSSQGAGIHQYQNYRGHGGHHLSTTGGNNNSNSNIYRIDLSPPRKTTALDLVFDSVIPSRPPSYYASGPTSSSSQQPVLVHSDRSFAISPAEQHQSITSLGGYPSNFQSGRVSSAANNNINIAGVNGSTNVSGNPSFGSNSRISPNRRSTGNNNYFAASNNLLNADDSLSYSGMARNSGDGFIMPNASSSGNVYHQQQQHRRVSPSRQPINVNAGAGNWKRHSTDLTIQSLPNRFPKTPTPDDRSFNDI